MSILETQGLRLSYDHYPDVCPRCHHALAPNYLVSSLSGGHENIGTILNMAFKCTNRNCLEMFIGVYKRLSTDARGHASGEFKFQKAIPKQYEAPEIPKEVESISQSFKVINQQAHAAESYDLNEIAGVGYRKALEFLIKDYCIYKNPDKEDEIKKKFLGVVIQDYVDDPNINACAKRAAWLGNDETHYIKKWKEKDITDLKVLIELTAGWVRSNLLTEKYMDDMN